MKRPWRLALAVMAWLVPLVSAGAQGGTVTGTVTVPNASVTDVVVYLVPDAPGGSAAKALTAAMDQRDLRFVPRVIAVTPGSTVVFSNNDRVMHNVFHPRQASEGFDLGLWAPGQSREFTFAREGAFVMLCQVHPEMVGYVVVVDSPYRAVTDGQGRFRMDGVAPGKYVLRTWHHRLEAHHVEVTVADGGVVRVELALKFGKTADPSGKR